MDCDDLNGLTKLLIFGSADSRRKVAEALVARNNPDMWEMLAGTVRAEGPWRLRARCLELLGMAAGSLDREQAETILDALLGDSEPALAKDA